MKKYNMLWHEIDVKNWPVSGEIYMCLDPQKRLGEKTWSVGIMGNGSMSRDSISLGLFWREEIADSFMMAVDLESVQELKAERSVN